MHVDRKEGSEELIGVRLRDGHLVDRFLRYTFISTSSFKKPGRLSPNASENLPRVQAGWASWLISVGAAMKVYPQYITIGCPMQY